MVIKITVFILMLVICSSCGDNTSASSTLLDAPLYLATKTCGLAQIPEAPLALAIATDGNLETIQTQVLVDYWALSLIAGLCGFLPCATNDIVFTASNNKIPHTYEKVLSKDIHSYRGNDPRSK